MDIEISTASATPSLAYSSQIYIEANRSQTTSATVNIETLLTTTPSPQINTVSDQTNLTTKGTKLPLWDMKVKFSFFIKILNIIQKKINNNFFLFLL